MSPASPRPTSSSTTKHVQDDHHDHDMDHRPHQHPQPRPCRFFRSRGGCRAGEACRFAHVAPPPRGAADEHDGAHGGRRGGGEAHEKKPHPVPHPQPPKGGKTSRNHRPAGVGARPPPPPRGAEQPPATPSTTPAAVAVGAGAEAAVEAVVDVGEGVAPAAAAVPSPARDAHKQKHPKQQQQQQRRRRKKSNQGQRAAQSPAPSQSPSPAPRVSTASASPKTVTCRYGPDCTIPNCGLRHSPDSSADRGHARGQTSRRGGVGNDGDGGEEASAGVPSPGPSGSGGLGSPPPVPAPADSPAPSPARMKGVQQQHHQQQRQRGQARGARNAAAVIPCRFFFSRGGSCARGASCKFSHVAASSGREESERRGAVRAGADGDGAAAASAETFDPAPTGPGDARAAHGGDADADAHEPGGPDDGGEAIAIVDEHERPERARGGGGDDDDHAEARTKGKPGQRQHKYERDCNFGERCKRRHCKYTHPNGRAIDRKQHQQQQQQKQSRIDGGVDASTAEAPLPPPRTAKIDPHSNDKHHNHNHDDDDLHIIHNDQSGNRNSNRTTSQADGGANDDTLAPIVPGAKAQHQKQPHRLRGNQERGEGRGRGARGKDASTSNMDEDYGKMNNNERSNNNNNNNTNNGRRADGANSHGQGADDAAEGTRRDLSSRAGHRAAGSGAAASRGMTIEKGAKAMATPTASPTATVRDGPSTTLRAKPGQPNVVLDSRVGEEGVGVGVGVGVSAADGPGDGDRGGKENVSHPRHNHPDKRKRGKKQRQQSAGVVDVDNRRSGEEEKKEMHPRDDHVGGGLVVPPPVERGSGDAEKATHAATTSKPQSVPFEDDAKTQGKPRTPTRPQEEGPWACARCTLINPASTARCEVCHFDPKSDSDATTAAGGPADARPNKDEETPEPTNKAGPNEWACRQCTLLNPKGQSRCGACERPRSPSTNDPHPPGVDDAAGRDAKPQTAVASDSNRPKGKPTADVEAKAKTKTGKNTTGKRAVGGVATHPIAREHPKSREEALEPAVRHLATLAQSSTLASAFERWTAYARERRAEDERANIREKMRRERENAQKRREEKKNKKRERWLREQEEQERVRRQFWEKEMAHEEEHVALLVELCVAEFVRQADDSKTEVTADTVKSDPSARSKLLYCCRRVYRQLFGDRGNRNVTVVDIQNKALHGRTGTIQYYDDDKGKFCVGLDTKKGKKAEMCFIKPGSLDVITRSKAAEQRKTSSATAEYHLEVPALYLGFDLIMSVSKSDVEAMRANGLDLCSYLDQLMERRDKEDNLRREEVKKAQRLQEERKKEDAKRRARMNEEWEEEKQRRDRDKAAREEMKRERRRHQRAGHSSPFQRRGPEAFFGGGMGGPTFVFSNGRGFVFFGGYDDFFDDEEDFFDHDGRFYDDEDSEEEREAARKEHAEVLGVAENASAQEIRSAYRKQALIYHPDKFKADAAGGMTKEAAEEHFKKMNNAYESLLGGFDN